MLQYVLVISFKLLCQFIWANLLQFDFIITFDLFTRILKYKKNYAMSGVHMILPEVKKGK